MSGLYRRVELGEPCQYVGCHPVRWRDRNEPTAAFVEAPEVEDEIEQLRAALAVANEAKERAERQRDALLAEARKQLAWWSKPEQPGMLLMEQVCDTIEEIIEALDDVGKEDEGLERDDEETADLAAANERAERAEEVLRAILDEDWNTLCAMAGESAADCKFTISSHSDYVLRSRTHAISRAAQVALDDVGKEDESATSVGAAEGRPSN